MQLIKVFALAQRSGNVLSWDYFASVLGGTAQELDTLPSVELKKVSFQVGNGEKL